MARTDLDVCNQAIGRVGGEPIDALNEDSPLSAYCSQFYKAKRDLCLSKYRWEFAAKVAQLAQRAPEVGVTPPMNFVYARPADLAGAIFAYRNCPGIDGPPVRAVNLGDDICCDVSPLWAEYTACTPEAQWPPGFTELVVLAFAADIARYRQNITLGREMDGLAWGTMDQRAGGQPGGQFAIASAEDARMAPQRKLANGGGCIWDAGPLVAARMGYGYGMSGLADAFGGQTPIVIVTPPGG